MEVSNIPLFQTFFSLHDFDRKMYDTYSVQKNVFCLPLFWDLCELENINNCVSNSCWIFLQVLVATAFVDHFRVFGCVNLSYFRMPPCRDIWRGGGVYALMSQVRLTILYSLTGIYMSSTLPGVHPRFKNKTCPYV